MSSVDERVVAMKMDYASFDKGVSATTSALDKLKKALTFDKESKSLNDLDQAGKKFSLAGIADGVDAIIGKFSALSIMGITALANIANKAVDAGLTIAKSLTIDPIKAGFDEYELKMGSIQTILANTAKYGTTLGQVTDSLDDLNKYADKTIYNFGDMTKNIGLFTNAGIRIEDATSMIKGFSNAAAASGTSASRAADAAYQLSQALSNGTVRLIDWRSLTTAGMGNDNMKDGLIQIATAMGTLTDSTVEGGVNTQNFNETLEKGWLTADVMSKYLKIMAGDMDDASMAALGLSDAQIATFKQTQKTAQEAATKVRTWTQLIGTLQEGVGSGWAQSFDIILGNFDEATELFSGIYNRLSPIIDAMSTARNDFLNAFVTAGGRDAVIGTLSSAFNTLMDIIRVVKRAFTDIFPPATGEQIANIAKDIQSFVEGLRPTPEMFRQIQSVAKGFFAVLDIGRMIIVQVWGVIKKLFGAVSGAGGGILEVSANIGDMLVKFRDAIKDGTALNKIFKVLGDVLVKPVEWLRKLGQMTVDTLSLENFQAVWENIAKAMKAVGDFLAPIVTWIGEAFHNIKEAVVGFFKTMDFNVLIGLMNVGAIGGLGLVLKKAFDGIKKWWEEFSKSGIMSLLFGKGDGEPGAFKQLIGALTDSLKEMQTTLKVGQLVAIAFAIGLLTASLMGLSTIDTGQLFISLSAMGAMFAMLSGSMVILDKFAMKGGAVKMAAVGGAMVGLGMSMLMLAAAAKIMSSMDWNEMARGIVGLAAGMTIMVGALAALDRLKFSPAGAGQIVLLSIALVVIASAFKIMSTLSWDDIGRSLAAMAGALIGLTGVMVIMDKMKFSPTGAASILGMSVALAVVAGALKVFASMSWDEIGRAMVVFGGVILGLVGALLILDTLKFSPVGAGAMIAMAVAINLLIPPMKAFSSMSWDEIGRAMTVLAGSLLILAGAMALFGVPIILLGSIGILAAAGALMMLAPAMKLLGTMSWDDIGRGLTVLAGALVILAAGGVLLIPALPGLLGLGAAIALIGVGVLAAGVGMTLLAAGILAFAGAATVGIDAIKMVVIGLIELIPSAMAAFAQGLIDFALVIANGGVEFTKAMTTLLQSLLDTINTLAPGIVDTIWNLVTMLVNKIVEGVPYFVNAALLLMTNFLNTLAARIPELAAAGTNVIVAFVTSIGDNAPKVADAAAKTIIKFVNGITDAIENNKAALRSAASRLSDAIVDGMTGGLSSRIGEVAESAANLASNALNAAKNFLNINSPSRKFFELGSFSGEGLANGLVNSVDTVAKAGKSMGSAALNAVTNTIANLQNTISDDMNLEPVIKPILDLSSIQRGSALIGNILGPTSLDVSGNYAKASSLSSAYRTGQESGDSEALNGSNGSSGTGVVINLTQNNSSPKTLSRAEIYRDTRNLISVAKKKFEGANT